MNKGKKEIVKESLLGILERCKLGGSSGVILGLGMRKRKWKLNYIR